MPSQQIETECLSHKVEFQQQSCITQFFSSDMEIKVLENGILKVSIQVIRLNISIDLLLKDITVMLRFDCIADKIFQRLL